MSRDTAVQSEPVSVAAIRPQCPVCNSENVVRWYKGEITNPSEVAFNYVFSPQHFKIFPVLRCRTCTHAFCWPIPNDMAARYVDSVDPEYLKHSRHRQLSAEQVFRQLSRHIDQGRLLDVGCATGDYLAKARDQGFTVEGVEISQSSSQLAIDAGFTVHRERLARLVTRREGFYDVVTLIGVLHELEKPAEEIQYIRRLLKPGGYLLLWTGDVDSVTSRILRRKWWYWQGQHIQYFTRRSLQRLMTSNGFEPVATTVFPFAATFENIQNSIRRYSFHRWLQPFFRALFAVKPVWYLRIPGEMLFLAQRSW